MSLLVSTAIEDLQRDLDSVGQEADDGDYYWALNKAVDYFRQAYDIPTGKRVTDIVLYPGVSEYELPSDFISLIPPRRAGAEEQSPDFSHERERDIYRHLGDRSLAVAFDRETPYLMAIDRSSSRSTINDCESLTGVTISGDGSDLKLDDRVAVSGGNSIQFLVTPSTGQTVISFALTSAIDISGLETTLRGFFNLYLPRAITTAITSVQFRLGNNSSNYLEWTKTQRYRGQSITGGWGVIGAQFEQAALLTEDGDELTTEDGDTIELEGSVDLSQIDYAAIVINHGTSSTVGGVWRVDSIFTSRGSYYELPYYSNQVIKDASNVYKASITIDTDTILFPLGSEGAIKYKTLEYLAAERWKDSGLANYFARELSPFENELRQKYPREIIVRTSSWMAQSRR